jgi:glycosyltransferase involved in cell wall biosynthesis/ADP-heptose:LPS heptosyltransferase
MDLSIIIPSRNRNARVVECVHALEHNQAEIIVVDDASQQRIVLPSDSARVIRHSRRRGRSACLNTGLQAARHDLVLIIDDDVYAAPDMVVRLVNEVAAQKHPKIGLAARVVWDPDAPLTLTMKWMESVHKFSSPMLLSRSFVLENGGYDENFTRRLEDTELQLRLKQQGFEVRRLETAVGFQNNVVTVRDLVEREFTEGISAVFLHAKFPQFMPRIDDMDMLLKNEAQAADASAAVDEIVLMEQSGTCDLPAGVSELYANVCRHYFLHGIFDGLRDIGGTKPRRNNSSTIAIYRHASHLEERGELDEARRLFRLVLHRPDEQFWDGAEYHLGCIETAFGNPARAREHFTECLRLNPTHNKARRTLNEPAHYREVDSNVFERIEQSGSSKILFILFGDLGHVVNAFPTVAALRKKFGCETAWLTASEYAALARASMANVVHEAQTRSIIPWDWIYEQGFTHVFFPEPGANHEEWERSHLHAIDFIAKKCQVNIDTHQSRFRPGANAVAEAEKFLRQHRLKRNGFITASRGDGEARHWPSSNLLKLAQQTDLRTVVFGKKGDQDISRTIPCLDVPLEVMAVLIGWSRFFLGPAYGVSWLATMTDTPMAVFFDPQDYNSHSSGFHQVLRAAKNDVQEWNIYTNFQTVFEHIESSTLVSL